ncbi:MAG TPA: flagellar biosynthesis anti-sigma factor FlgM [Steroidobacteraceae bacterium]|nr:flagellar biosynthesis anti-sigma factor FlgM [Steroidobacteraceae bacterium]
MASKISGVDTRTGPVGSGRAVERVRDATTGGRTEPGAASASADVQITGTALQLADLEQQVKDMPAVDEARVAAISSALAEGRYQISPERIADQLIQIEQALAPLGEKEQ